MDLFLTAVGLYLWQCIVFLPRGAALFTLPRRRNRLVPIGPDQRIQSPWPFDVTIVSQRFPFEMDAKSVHAPTVLPGAGVSEVEDSTVLLDEISEFEARGGSVLATGRAFLRAATAEHAAHWTTLLNRLTRGKPKQRRALFGEFIEAAFDVESCRTAIEDALRRARPLRWCCALYFVLAFLVLPILGSRLDAEAAILRTWPLLAAVHVVSLAAMLFADVRAERRATNRTERFLIAALYPPALLRAPSESVSQQLVAFHPATIAACILEPEAAAGFVRRELAEVDHPRWERHGRTPPPSAEARRRSLGRIQNALRKVLRTIGAPDSNFAAKEHRDPAARSYCPICLSDFRAVSRYCASCGVATIDYDGNTVP